MQTLDAVQQLLDLTLRKIGDADEVDILAEGHLQTINQHREALRESLQAFSEQKKGAEKKFQCMHCRLHLTGLQTVLNHKHPDLDTEWIVPLPT